VEFADAAIALEDENALTVEGSDHTEPRFKTLGLGPTRNILFVVHCEQSKDCIRITLLVKQTRGKPTTISRV